MKRCGGFPHVSAKYIQSDNDAIAARMSSIKVGAIHSEPNSLSEIQKLFRPWVITHICCFVAFSTQMVLISQEQGGIKWGIRGSGILDSEGSHR